MFQTVQPAILYGGEHGKYHKKSYTKIVRVDLCQFVRSVYFEEKDK